MSQTLTGCHPQAAGAEDGSVGREPGGDRVRRGKDENMKEKPIAYRFTGPDGAAHFVGLRDAAEWLGIPYPTVRSAVLAGGRRSAARARVEAEFPDLVRPLRAVRAEETREALP